jgi:plasmid maintenance system antidote protein VapI
MGNWAKKIEKHVGDDLQPGERLLQGAFVQPLGTSKQMMARSLGGIAGAAIAAKMRGRASATSSRPHRSSSASPISV